MITHDDVRAILNLGESTLSIYLNVDPADAANQNTPPAYEIWLKNALRSLEERHADDDHATRMALAAMSDTARQRLAAKRPEAKGFAVFAKDGQWLEYALPVAVPNHAAFPRPHIAPLLQLLDAYRSFGVVRIDSRDSLFLDVLLGRPEVAGGESMLLLTNTWRETSLMPTGATGITAGTNRDVYEDRVAAQQQRFYRDVAGRATSWLSDAGLSDFVLAGDEQAMAALAAEFPEHLKAGLLGTTAAPAFESEQALMERAAVVAERGFAQREEELVAQIKDATLAGGAGALGVSDVLNATQAGRGHLIALAWPPEGRAAVCEVCGATVVDDVTVCPACGGRMVSERIEELLPRLAAANGTELRFVHGPAAASLAEYGGVGAFLRY